MRSGRLTLAVVTATALLAGLGTTHLQAVEHNVSIVGTQFTPANIVITEGDVVRWTNNSILTHTSTSGNSCSPNGIWNSGVIGIGKQFSFTFTTPGNYPYYCIPHCLIGMTGLVIVNEAPIPVKPSTWGSIKSLFHAQL